MQETQDKALIDAAIQARSNAYAPYSVYSVGAAVLAADGNIYQGCNVENVSYGLTVCAERNAIASMVSAGATSIEAIAIATKDGARPCGACLQVMLEFAGKNGVSVLCVDDQASVVKLLLSELLPHAFKLEK